MVFCYRVSKLKDGKEVAFCELSSQELKQVNEGIFYAMVKDMNSEKKEVYRRVRQKFWKLGLGQ